MGVLRQSSNSSRFDFFYPALIVFSFISIEFLLSALIQKWYIFFFILNRLCFFYLDRISLFCLDSELRQTPKTRDFVLFSLKALSILSKYWIYLSFGSWRTYAFWILKHIGLLCYDYVIPYTIISWDILRDWFGYCFTLTDTKAY
jgi:hypothetical protein